MKKLIIALAFFCLGAFSVHAQQETQSFDVDGIKVIFKPTLKNVINVRAYFKGGVTNYDARQAGIEEVALNAAIKCGTLKYSPAAFRDTSDRYGIFEFAASTYDFGFIQVNCISKYFDRAWGLFSDAVVNPVFDENEVKLLKDKTIGALHRSGSNPDSRLAQLQVQNAFSNTPYAVDPAGTEELINSLSADDLKNYYKTLLNKNKIFIVVVGNISKQDIYDKIHSAFGSIPSMPYASPDLKPPVLNDNKLLVETRELKINYIGAVMNSPAFTDKNYIPFRLGILGLGGNIYQYLRSQRNLSYNPAARTMELKMPYTIMSASSNDIGGTMEGMLITLKNIQNNGVNDEWLQHIKNMYITSTYINDQNVAAISANLGVAEILGGWQYADKLTKLVQSATVEQVNNALNFYVTGLRWTVLGNPNIVDSIKPPSY